MAGARGGLESGFMVGIRLYQIPTTRQVFYIEGQIEFSGLEIALQGGMSLEIADLIRPKSKVGQETSEGD
jgi:hypothetical protein